MIRSNSSRRTWTGAAIVFSFVVYAVLLAAYVFLFRGFIWIFARYDLYGYVGFILYMSANALAPLGAMIVTDKVFKNANLQAVYYAFVTVSVVLTLLGIVFGVSTVGQDGGWHISFIVVGSTVSCILSVGGARLGFHLAANRNKDGLPTKGGDAI